MKTRTFWSLSMTAAIVLGAGCSNTQGLPPGAANSAGRFNGHATTVTIDQFRDLPHSSFYFPVALTVGPDKALWVADDIDQDAGHSAIARITTAGRRTKTFYYPNSASPAFSDIVAGPDGAFWITDLGDGQILRMTTDGKFTAFPLNRAAPQGIVSGPDRALWFTENYFGGVAVVRMKTNGAMKAFSHGISPNTGLEDIAVGSDGALWFTEPDGNRIGRITTRGRVSEFSSGISPGSKPYSIAPGPDGALWFTEIAGGRIGRISTAGSITEYSQGITPTEQPQDIGAGPDGALWFTEYETHAGYFVRDSKIGRITTAGVITEYSGIRHKSAPQGIVAGPDGNVWFVEEGANRVGRVNLR